MRLECESKRAESDALRPMPFEVTSRRPSDEVEAFAAMVATRIRELELCWLLHTILVLAVCGVDLCLRVSG